MRADPRARSQACIERDASGQQRWFGELPQALQRGGAALQAVAEKYPDQVAGVAYCSRYDAVMIFTDSVTSSDFTADLEAVVATHADVTFFHRDVKASLTELQQASAAIITDRELVKGVVSVGADATRGEVVVSVANGAWPSVDEAARQISQLAPGVSVRVVESAGARNSVKVSADEPPS